MCVFVWSYSIGLQLIYTTIASLLRLNHRPQEPKPGPPRPDPSFICVEEIFLEGIDEIRLLSDVDGDLPRRSRLGCSW